MSIEITADAILLQSPYLKRNIQLADGPFSCDIFVQPPGIGAPMPLHLDTGWGLPFEAAVQIDGVWHFCGVKHQHSVLWESLTNDFQQVSVEKKSGLLGDCAELLMASPSLGITLAIEYEVSDTLPVMRKSVKVVNNSGKPVKIDNLCPEIIYRSRTGHLLHFLHDYRHEVEGHERFFAGYCDFRFPGTVDVELQPVETIACFNLYELFLPESQVSQRVWRSRVMRALVPWALESRETTFQFSGVVPGKQAGFEPFIPVLQECAAAGFEKIMFFWDQLFTNTGDYEPRKEFFPQGMEDMASFFGCIRQLGMKIGIYASYSIALPESRVRLEHPDWECCDENGITFDPGAFGNMCFLSGWGNYIREKFDILCDMGVAEIQIDGPTDIPCWRKGHNHTSQGNYHYRNWQWEKELFAHLRERGVAFTIPRGPSYLLMGASAIPGGYKEEDFCHSSNRDLLRNYRASMSGARDLLPAWSVWGFLATGNYHGHKIDVCESDPDLFEQGLASLFGCGQNRAISGNMLSAGPETFAIIRRWVSLFKEFRHIFNGDVVNAGVPWEDAADGFLFLNREKEEALAVLINAGDTDFSRNILFPLHYGNLSGKVTVTGILGENRETYDAEADEAGQLFLRVNIPAGKVKLLHFTR